MKFGTAEEVAHLRIDERQDLTMIDNDFSWPPFHLFLNIDCL